MLAQGLPSYIKGFSCLRQPVIKKMSVIYNFYIPTDLTQSVSNIGMYLNIGKQKYLHIQEGILSCLKRIASTFNIALTCLFQNNQYSL